MFPFITINHVYKELTTVSCKMAMQYAVLDNGREVAADDIGIGSLRSNSYKCISCNQDVLYVTKSYRARAHFRHKNNESCISLSSYQKREKDAECRVQNRKSHFHKWWQSLFSKEDIEVRISENNMNHIADIYFISEICIKITMDNGESMFKYSKKELVIEVQHSYISAEDAKSRYSLYNTYDRELLWIFDISHINHNLDRFITLTQDRLQIIFPDTQHSGLINVIKVCKNSVILLDTGTYLFKVEHVYFDHGYTSVIPISKSRFLQQLHEYNPNMKSALFPDVNITYERSIRNYRLYLEALDARYQVDVDEIINMIEDIPVTFLREGCELHADDRFDTYVEMITSWLGSVSHSDPIVYKMLQMWIPNVKKRFYSKDYLTFGKHEGVPFYKLPESYVTWILQKEILGNTSLNKKILELSEMNETIIGNYFKRPKGVMYFKKCRDSYYRSEWDKRTFYSRKAILQSIYLRPWISLIKEIVPSSDGYVCVKSYCSGIYFPNIHCEYQRINNKNMYRFQPVHINGKYISICERDLLLWYGIIDDHFKYHYTNHNLYKEVKLEKYAFRDFE